MNDLRIITSSALLGTERNPLGACENTKLENARTQLAAGGSATQLLGTAMLAFNMTRAGFQANSSIGALTPADMDMRPCILKAARGRLTQLLATQPDLIPEWMKLANERGYRVPHSQIISLLDYGRQHLELRQTILPLLDVRGRWLAQQNPHWAWASGDISSAETALETWETGGKAARALAFRSIRAADPEQARALLGAVWKTEALEERKNFLAEFEALLSDSDEVFLESCLDDRSKDVRQLAAGFLAKLPNSAYVQRMTARGIKLLKNDTKELEVILPEWNNDFARDGIEKKPPHGIGEKAHWWQSIIARVPLEVWLTHLNLEPSKILKRLPKTWRANFIAAILETELNLAWALALLEQNSKLMENHKLMNSLPLETREKRVRYFIFQKAELDATWLDWMEHDWSIEFSQDVLEWLGVLGGKIMSNVNTYFYLGKITQHLHLDVLENWQNYFEWSGMLQQLEQQTPVEQAIPAKKHRAWYIQYFHEQTRSLIQTITTRTQMRKELS